MTPDQAFYAFSSISLAAVLLAFLLGFRSASDFSGRELLETIVNKRPSRRNKDRYDNLIRKTEIADKAMAARERGERFVPPSDYNNR